MTTMSTQHDIDVLYMYMYNKFRYGAPQKMFSTCNNMALIRVNIQHPIFSLLIHLQVDRFNVNQVYEKYLNSIKCIFIYSSEE